MKKKLILPSFFIILSLLLAGCGCENAPVNQYKVSLEVWGLFDDSDVFATALSEYKKAHSDTITDVTYKKLTIDSYESELLNALASGKGPDIFLIHNTWLERYKDKVAASPAELMSEREVNDQFVDVINFDFLRDGKIYALPMSVDSLALYYNKDLFNQAGITRPPETWKEFNEAVARLTAVDSFGNITRSGAAMGLSSDAGVGGGKINRATDILALLMLQAGAKMQDELGIAKFADRVSMGTANNDIAPGKGALEYYTSFSNRRSVGVYAWNSTMHNSVDSFVEGKTAMMLNYSWMLERVRRDAPQMNLGIAVVPQNIVDGQGEKMSFANYWGFAVSANKLVASPSGTNQAVSSGQQATNDQRVSEAWSLVRFLTMQQGPEKNIKIPDETGQMVVLDPAALYAKKQKKPAARRDIIAQQKTDPVLGPFSEGNLVAKSWRQPDNLAVEKIFDAMIDDVALRSVDPEEAVREAQNKVNLLVKREY